MIDRVAAASGPPRSPKCPSASSGSWTACVDGSFGFGGEESAGASFLRRDGRVWTTDKDGIILDLLAAEITAVTGRDPGEHYEDLEGSFGSPVYERIDAPATADQKAALSRLSPDDVTAAELAGEPIQAKLTRAPATAPPSAASKSSPRTAGSPHGPPAPKTIYKIYAESFIGPDHLAQSRTKRRPSSATPSRPRACSHDAARIHP